MSNDITVEKLSEELLRLAKVNHTPYAALAFAYGALTGIFESVRKGNKDVQKVLNDSYTQIQKDLSEH